MKERKQKRERKREREREWEREWERERETFTLTSALPKPKWSVKNMMKACLTRAWTLLKWNEFLTENFSPFSEKPIFKIEVNFRLNENWGFIFSCSKDQKPWPKSRIETGWPRQSSALLSIILILRCHWHYAIRTPFNASSHSWGSNLWP